MFKFGKSAESLLTAAMGICLFLCVLWMCLQPAAVSELWWQLRVGNEIRITHHIPRYDEFSWTSHGGPIVFSEWGSCLIFAECYRYLGGLSGIWLAEIALVTLTFIGLFYILLTTTESSPFIAFLLTLAAAFLCGNSLSPSPQLFSYLFLVISIAILNSFRVKHRVSPFGFIGLILIQILWANLHTAGPVFIAICFCFAIGDGLHYCLERNRDKELSSLYLKNCAIALACGTVSLATMSVNPYGPGIFRNFVDNIASKTGSSSSLAAGWRPADFHTPYGQTLEIFVFFIGFVLTATKKKNNIGDVLALIALIVSALYMVWSGPFLGLAGCMILATYAPSAVARLTERYSPLEALSKVISRKSFRYSLVATLCLIVAFAMGICQSWFISNAGRSASIQSLADNVFMIPSVPEDACTFIEREKIPDSLHLYNEDNAGGYIIWRLPEYQVFSAPVDSTYNKSITDVYQKMQHIPFDWRSVLAPYDPKLVVIGTDDVESHLFLDAPDWALVYMDSSPASQRGEPSDLVFIKRSQNTTTLIKQCRQDCPEVQFAASKGYLSAQ